MTNKTKHPTGLQCLALLFVTVATLAALAGAVHWAYVAGWMPYILIFAVVTFILGGVAKA